jgi:proton-dependent oligopeptide transporter, POT family
MAAKTLLYAPKHGFKLDAAKPVFQAVKYGISVPWDYHFVAEMKRGLLACRVLLVVPFQHIVQPRLI